MKSKWEHKIILLTVLAFISTNIIAQTSCRNGYWLSNNGTIRIFVVFAEVVGDPNYENVYPGWPKGEMPVNPGFFFDHIFNALIINGKVTKLYDQASFRNFTLLGDYYPNLVKINYSDIKGIGKGDTQVQNYLKNIVGNDLTTTNTYSFNSDAFDSWIKPSSKGQIKNPGEDDYIDAFFIIWRVNSKISTKYDGSGTIDNDYTFCEIKDKDGFQEAARIVSWNADAWRSVMHEFAHSLLGGTEMHSAGNVAGTRVFISSPGGYSILSYAEAIGSIYNGYDRYRLGWKHSDNTYYISARKATDNSEIDANMTYGQSFPGEINDFILRDFVTTGDAIRIKLPYLKSENSLIYDQWLWLENHQMKNGNIDLNMSMAKGLYAYIQVGKEDFTQFLGLSNYLYPVHAFGQFDFEYEKSKLKSANDLQISQFSKFGKLENEEINVVDKLIVKSEKANPFTGYNIIMNMAYNLTEPNKLNNVDYTNEIFRNETFLPQAVEKDGVILPESNFHLPSYPSYGSMYDMFVPGRKINIGTNPASTPVLTYQTRGDNNRPNSNAQQYDNRKIYLNGLSVEFIEQRPNGDIKVRIRWDNFDVNSNVRWCGPIVLNEKVFLKPYNSITIDQGLTPTKPVNPLDFNGEKIFADYTVFTSRNASMFVQETNTTVTVKNNSALVLESGSNYEINEGGILYIKAGSTLHVKSGANLLVRGSGKIEVESGGYICVEEGSNITLQNILSHINLRPGYITGVNPNVITGTTNCRSTPLSIVYTGYGSINTIFTADNFIQNITITTNKTYTGRNVYAGQAVNLSQPQGPVIIKPGCSVILDGTASVLLDTGFEAQAGSSFEMK